MNKPPGTGGLAPRRWGSDDAFQSKLTELSAMFVSRVVPPRTSLQRTHRRDVFAQRMIKSGLVTACIAIGCATAYGIFHAAIPADAGTGFWARQMNAAASPLHLHEELPFAARGSVPAIDQSNDKSAKVPFLDQATGVSEPTLAGGKGPARSTEASRPARLGAVINDRTAAALGAKPEVPHQAISIDELPAR